jgi:hypothetical protein
MELDAVMVTTRTLCHDCNLFVVFLLRIVRTVIIGAMEGSIAMSRLIECLYCFLCLELDSGTGHIRNADENEKRKIPISKVARDIQPPESTRTQSTIGNAQLHRIGTDSKIYHPTGSMVRTSRFILVHAILCAGFRSNGRTFVSHFFTPFINVWNHLDGIGSIALRIIQRDSNMGRTKIGDLLLGYLMTILSRRTQQNVKDAHVLNFHEPCSLTKEHNHLSGHG